MTTTTAEAPSRHGPVEAMIRQRIEDEGVRKQRVPRLFVPRAELGALFAELGDQYEPMRHRLFRTAEGDAVCEIDKIKLVVDFAEPDEVTAPPPSAAEASARIEALETSVGEIKGGMAQILELLKARG